MIKRISKDTYQIGIKDSKGKFTSIVEIYGIFYLVNDEEIELHWTGFMTSAVSVDTREPVLNVDIVLAMRIFDIVVLPHLDGVVTKCVRSELCAPNYKYEWNGDL